MLKILGYGTLVGLGLYFGVIQMLFVMLAAVLFWGSSLFAMLGGI